MNDTNKSTDRKQVSLCRGKTCCPQLIVEDDKYIITDDFGGKVVLEKEHITELINEFYKLTKTPEEIQELRETTLNSLIKANVRDLINGKREGIVFQLENSGDFVLKASQKTKNK